jgi:capsid protein
MSVENQQRDPSAPLEGMLSKRGAGPVVKDTGQEFATQSTDEPSISYQSLPEATITTPGSVGIFNMQQGDTMKLLENKTPAESYQSFIDAFVSYLSASMSMPIEVLLMKFNQSYSASRATLILFWRIANIWREEMAADYLNPIFEAWLSGEIAAGRISAPGWGDPILRAAWINNHWIGTPMPNIDPLRESKASKEYLTMGATTQNRVARNLNGSSASENQIINQKMFPNTPIPPWEQKGEAKNNPDQNPQVPFPLKKSE